MSSLLRIAVLVVLALAPFGATGAAEICTQLKAELTALSESYAAPAKVRKYARAIAEQKLTIRGLRHQMRESGCSAGSLFVLGGENQDECAEFEGKMARMEANLAILNEKRLSLLIQQDGDERRRLLAALEDHECHEQPVLARTTADPRASDLISAGVPPGYETIRLPQPKPGYGDSRFVDLGGSATNGTLRTMCVRTCDGAYFPISSQATSLSFHRDAQVCSMMCPGMETELFYHPINQESDSMRSALDGRSYSELNNAYRFRISPRTASCNCNFALYYREMMRREAFIDNPAKDQAKQSSIIWVRPELRGHLAQEVKVRKAANDVELREYKPDEHIRQIGPTFLPDKEELDLSNPRSAAER